MLDYWWQSIDHLIKDVSGINERSLTSIFDILLVVAGRRLTHRHGWGQLNYLCGTHVVFFRSGWLYVEASGWWFIDAMWLQTHLFIRLSLFLLSCFVCHAMPLPFDWSINAAPLPLSNLLTCHSLATASIN